jgi:hypothetical protein
MGDIEHSCLGSVDVEKRRIKLKNDIFPCLFGPVHLLEAFEMLSKNNIAESLELFKWQLLELFFC